MSSSTRGWLGFVVAVMLFPGSARAQTVAQSFEELQRILKAEDVVVVIDRADQQSTGRVAEVSASSLVLVLVIAEKTPEGLAIWTSGARRTFTADAVAEIWRSDLSGEKGARVYRAPARFQDLQRTLKVGQTVRVTDVSGQQTSGRVEDVSASSLTVLTPATLQRLTPATLQRRTFAEATVERISTVDRLRNGTLIGMAIGIAVPAAIIFGVASQPGGDIGEGARLLFVPVGDLGFPVCCWGFLGAGIGALVGAAIDKSADHQKVLYLSPRQSAQLRLSPVVERDRQGVLVSVRF
jgi:hypothetical protein